MISCRPGVLACIALCVCSARAWAGEFSFKGETDKPPVSYKAGEKIVFKVQLLEDGKPLEGRKLKWIRTGDDGKTHTGEAVSSATQPLIVETSSDTPGFVRMQVLLLGADGKPIVSPLNKNWHIEFLGGAGVDIEKIRNYPEPEDFDAFWARQKADLAKVPVKASLTEVPCKDPRFLAYDVKVDCLPGIRPVSGYLTKPKDAKAKSLSARVSFQSYGVYSVKQVVTPGAMMFSVNAHGIENGKDAKYYSDLSAGDLAGYGSDPKKLADPETCEFRGMLLRNLRALEFLKTLPEWDGKNVVVGGSSQGGYQSLCAAGLCDDVTECIAGQPWGCDIGGVKLGRQRGWYPPYTDALRYFDAANLAKRIKCKTTIKAGLGDYTCPPSGLALVYYNIKAPKQITFLQGTTHGYTPPNPQTVVLSSGMETR